MSLPDQFEKSLTGAFAANSTEGKENSEKSFWTEFDSFVSRLRCADETNRNTAFANLVSVVRILNPVDEVDRILFIFGIYESEFHANNDASFRCTLLRQLPSLYSEAYRIEYIFDDIHDIFTNILLSALDYTDDGDSSNSVNKTALTVIGSLVEQRLMPQGYVEHIFKKLLRLSTSDGVEIGNFCDQARFMTILLISKIVELIGGSFSKAWIFQFFLPSYLQLLHGSTSGIKKELVLILPVISTLLGSRFIEEFSVPYILTLGLDERYWSNRSCCCEVLPRISKLCSPRARELKLAPLYITLLHDDARWVVKAAFENLGPFIATFAESIRSLTSQEHTICASQGYDRSSSSHVDVSSIDMVDENGMQVDFTGLLISFIPQYLPNNGRTATSYSSTEKVLKELNSLLERWNKMQFEKDSERAEGRLDTISHPCRGELGVYSTHLDLSKVCFSNNCDMTSEYESDGDLAPNVEAALDDFDYYSYWARNVNEDCTLYEESYAHPSSECYAPFRYLDSFYPAKHHDSEGGEEKKIRHFTTNDASSNVEQKFSPLASNFGSKDARSATLYDSQLPVPKELIESFVQIVSSCSSVEINYHGAHNFPAIAYTVGRENWLYLKEAYLLMCTDAQCRVRASMASSIHEVAAIIGEGNTAKYLLPIFEMFMRDVEDVKMALLKHFYDFVKRLPARERTNLLSMLATFLHSVDGNELKWRFRHLYARQCTLLCDLYRVPDLNKYLSGIALTLAVDKVADVRIEGAALMALILGRFVREEWSSGNASNSTEDSPIPLTESFVNDVTKGFAKSIGWKRRHTFVLFCQSCLEEGHLNYDQFSSLLLDDLVHLSTDAVVNIRTAFARSLSSTRGGRAFHGTRDSSFVRKCLETLVFDTDVDCRRVARKALGIPESEEYIDVKGRDKHVREKENRFFENASEMNSQTQ